MRETVDKELLWVVHTYNTDVVKRKCSTLSLYISKITSRHLANTKNNIIHTDWRSFISYQCLLTYVLTKSTGIAATI